MPNKSAHTERESDLESDLANASQDKEVGFDRHSRSEEKEFSPPRRNLALRVGSGLVRFSGFHILVTQPLKTLLEIARPGAEGIARMAKDLVVTEPVRKLHTDEIDPAKRFEVARLSYGRDKAYLDQATDSTNKIANFFLVLWGLAMAFGIVSLRVDYDAEGFNNVAFHVFPFALPLALTAMWMRFAFWNWQIRRRRLDGFGAWLTTPREWLTEATAPSPTRRRRISSWLALLAVGIMLAPAFAYAANPFEFLSKAIPSTDYYMHMLGMMFSGIGPIQAIDSNYSTPLAKAFNAWLSVLSLLGSALLAWGTFVGLVATAHEGSVLGKRFHTLWAPTRVVIGFSSLLPVVSGYCAAQILLLQIFVWGGGIANMVWSGYLETFSPPAASQTAGGQSPISIIEPSMRVMGTAFVKELAQKEVCRQTIHAAETATGNQVRIYGTLLSRFGSGDPAIRYDVPKAEKKAVEGRDIYVWDFGVVCGQVTLDPGPESRFTGSDNLFTGNSVGKAQLADFKAAYRARVVAAGTIANGIDGMMQPVSEFATAWVDAVQPPFATNRDGKIPGPLQVDQIDPRLIQAVEGFVSSQKAAANDVFQSVAGQLGKPMVDVAKQAGWASAPVFFNTIHNLQKAASDMARFSPSLNGGDLSLLPEDTRLGLVSAQDGDPARATLTALALYINKTMASTPDITAAAVQAGAMDNDGIDGLLTGMVNSAMGTMMQAVSPDPNNALLDMANFGHTLLWTFYGILATWPIIIGLIEVAKLTSLGATVATTLTSFATGGATAPAAMASAFTAGATSALGAMLVGPFSFFGKMFLFALWAAGAAHAYILPMLPFVFFVYFLGGLMILAVEAMVAAPLWAMNHIKMDGEDFAGTAKQGYMITFNMLSRPTLALFGLILSSGVFGAVIWFLNKTFYPMALSVFAGSGNGLVGAILMVIAMALLHYQMAIRSFALIAQVPDRVTRWFGQSGDNLGEESDTHKATAFLMSLVNRTEGVGRAAGVRAAATDTGKPGDTKPVVPDGDKGPTRGPRE